MRNHIVLRSTKGDAKILDYSVSREGRSWAAEATSIDPWKIRVVGVPGQQPSDVVDLLAEKLAEFFNRIEEGEELVRRRETVTEVRDGVRWRRREIVGVNRRRIRWEVEAVMLMCEVSLLPADTEVSS